MECDVTRCLYKCDSFLFLPREDSPHNERQRHAKRDESPARDRRGGVQFHTICEGSLGLEDDVYSESSSLDTTGPGIVLESTSGTLHELHDNFPLDCHGLAFGKGDQVERHERRNHLFDGGHNRVPCNPGTRHEAV